MWMRMLHTVFVSRCRCRWKHARIILTRKLFKLFYLSSISIVKPFCVYGEYHLGSGTGCANVFDEFCAWIVSVKLQWPKEKWRKTCVKNVYILYVRMKFTCCRLTILGRWLLFPMFCILCEKFLVILLSPLIEFYLLLVFIIVVVVVLLPVCML